MKTWCELSTSCERERFGALSRSLTEAGFENTVEFVECEPGEFPTHLTEALKKYDQIRIGGKLRDLVHKEIVTVPAEILVLKSVDALVKSDQAVWARNFLVPALSQTIVADLKNVDLSGGVFILGATPEARAIVASFSRFGFARFTIADPDETNAQAIVGELKSLFFKLVIEPASSAQITQLPGIHSVAINTLAQGHDGGSLPELFFFNFLKAGGVWLDLPLIPYNSLLEAEAKSVGARVASAVSVAARVDLEWSKVAFGVQLDFDRYGKTLTTVIGRKEEVGLSSSYEP